MVIIRSAKIKDLKEVVKMRLKLGKYEEKIENYFTLGNNAKLLLQKIYKEYINAKSKKLLVVEIDNKIIGFGSAQINSSNAIFKIKEHGYIVEVYVDKKFRRRGVAGEILKVFYKWFRKNNIKYIELNVLYHNELGRNAWTKYGFKDCLIKKIKILK